MITPDQFNNLKASLSQLVERQRTNSEAAALDGGKTSAALEAEKKHLTENALRVLVMGQFNGGKSTFLNALMGKMLLPAKARPTTAIIGKIVYSEKASATLYPKEEGKKPFDVKVDELNNYIVIEHNDDGEKKQPAGFLGS